MAITREKIKQNIREKGLSASFPPLLEKQLIEWVKNDFFLRGEAQKDDQIKLFKDYFIKRPYFCNGNKKFIEFFPKGTHPDALSDQIIFDKMSEIFGSKENAAAILEANTHEVSTVIYNLFLSRVHFGRFKPDEMGMLKFILYPNNHQVIINLFFDKEKNCVKLHCTCTSITVTNGEETGLIEGPITAEFILRQQDKHWRFQLDSLPVSVPLIRLALTGGTMSLDTVFLNAKFPPRAATTFWGRLKSGFFATIDSIAEEFDDIGNEEEDDFEFIAKAPEEKQQASSYVTPLMIVGGLAAGALAVAAIANQGGDRDKTSLKPR